MYRMIAIDIDDTLITDEKEITPGTKKALQAAVERGVIVTLATGRMFISTCKYAEQLGLNVPIITYQGAFVKNWVDHAVLYERSVPADAAAYIMDYADKHNLHIQVYCNDELYAPHENEKLIGYSQLSDVPYTIKPELRELPMNAFHKMIFIDEPAVLDRIAQELKAHFGKSLHITKSKPNFLEFTHPEGTKGHAVRFLAKHYGIDLTEVIAIGDSWNDHEMLEAAGLGVAMENATPTLKQIADYITLSNNHEGVKHVIEKFIL